MKVRATQTVQLTVAPEEFEVKFAWNKKRGVEGNHWFTPSGICKMYIGGLHHNRVGKVQPKVYKELYRQAKANKTELFTWGSTYYCLSNDDSIDEVYNMPSILYQARAEWEERKYVEYWVEDNRVLN
jgi:hypothetical protein